MAGPLNDKTERGQKATFRFEEPDEAKPRQKSQRAANFTNRG
jgi:hypothetical protein